MTWTRFMDMHSGGGQKLEWSIVLIEQPEAEAKAVFFKRFGRNPEKVTCTCCGPDYSISSQESLAQLTGYDRGCHVLKTPRDPATGLYRNSDPVIMAHGYLEEGESPPAGYEIDDKWPSFNKYQTLDAYLALPNVKVIRASEITPEETKGTVPRQGYVWIDEEDS